VRAFRAQVLFDHGRRPHFLATTGQYSDPDPADRDAYHVIASSDDGIAGCFRVLPLADAHAGLCERLVGGDRLDDVLHRLGTDRTRVSEGGGWAVDPHHRGQGLGLRLLATGVAMAERLGLEGMIGASGVRFGQCRLLERTGSRPVPFLDLLPVPWLADDVRVMFAWTRALRPDFRDLVREAGTEMGLRLS